MKRIRSFNEAKSKKVVQETHEEKLNKIKSEWVRIENQTPWEFDYFWDKVNSWYKNERFVPTNGDLEVNMEGFRSHYMDRNIYSRGDDNIFMKDIEWRKRNAVIELIVNTGGYSGGSCYDTGEDEVSQPYETGNSINLSDFIDVMESLFYYIFGSNHPFGDVKRLIDKLKEDFWNYGTEDDFTKYEYYGNSDDYSFISINLWDLYKFLSKNEAF